MWEPNEEEKKYLDLIAGMTVDCRMGRGTDSRKTYLENLEEIIRQMSEQE